jgi:hypothetical protein
MRLSYGEVILKKGSILYHTSDEQFIYKDEHDKPFLFCTFHPSEYGTNNNNSYIHFIKLEKDISLLFMIEKIKKNLIFSSLHMFTLNKKGNLSKMNKNKLLLFSAQLKNNNFDGWLTSINNKTNIEVALLNNKNLYKLFKSNKLNENWINSYYENNILIHKKWGINYPICTIINPIIFIINERFKEQIDEYKKLEINSKFLSEYVFQIILNNAKIKYVKGEYKKFNWNK